MPVSTPVVLQWGSFSYVTTECINYIKITNTGIFSVSGHPNPAPTIFWNLLFCLWTDFFHLIYHGRACRVNPMKLFDPSLWSLFKCLCITDGWMDDLQFYVLFNSISVLSGQWDVDNERRCAMEHCLWLRRFCLERGSNSGPSDQ